MSDQQKIQLQTNLAQTHMQQQIEMRKKLLQGKGKKRDSSDESDNSNVSDDSDGSGW